MKQATIVLSYLLFALIILFPVGAFVSGFFGYTFKLISVSAFSIIIAILSVCSVVLSLITKDADKSRPIGVLLAVIAPLSMINAFFYIFECNTIFVAKCVFISSLCCCFLTVKHGKPLALKIVALVLSALMVIPIGLFSFIILFFNLCQNTVVQTVESPNRIYYAEVVDSNQGALGGDTFVYVYKRSGINAIIFKIEKSPQRVYWGDWGAFENMEIYWRDDSCLVIDSIEYEIK